MSIHIKEYLSFLAVVGIIRLFYPDPKCDFVLKVVCFGAIITMVLMPLKNELSKGFDVPYVNEASVEGREWQRFFDESLTEYGFEIQAGEGND